MITDLARRNDDLFRLSPVFDLFDSLFPRNFGLVLDDVGSFKVDVRETDSQYIVEAELPSIKEDEVNVELDNGLMTITVEKDDCKESCGHYHMRERRYGRMSRSFRIPSIDASSVDASLKDGILTISINKTPESRAQKVKIKSG